MGLLYTVSFAAVAVTAAQDLFEITAPADAVVIIHSVVLSQSSDLGDAQEEALPIQMKRGATTTGSGGTTVTAVPLETGFPAAGSTCKVNNTTKATGGTISVLHSENWYIRGPYPGLPTPEIRHVLSPGQRYTVELVTGPADSITMSGTLYFEEIGG